MEVVVEQRPPAVDTDVEDAAEAGGLQSRRKSRHQYSGAAIVHGLTKEDNSDGETSDNTAYLDENGGALEDLDIHKIPISGDAINYGITETAGASSEETGESIRSELTEEEIVEEELIELEFEKAIHKLQTHTMHCPNCDAHITKVVLRRKIITARRRRRPPIDESEKPVDLLGCLSCFSLFTSTGNPFSIFGEKSRVNAVPQRDGNEGEIVSREDGNCFSIFRVFRKGPNVPIIEDIAQPGLVDSPSSSPTPDTKYVASKPLGGHGESRLDVTPENPESSIDIPPAATSPAAMGGQTQEQDSTTTSFEILKSVVYGGLMEVIASSSVIASAVAADATTLTIVSLALANLIGGIFVIGHNLWDLRNDCYKFSNQVTRNKYKELLGRIEHFPLHAFFAILSFFVFGAIPPVAYGYSIHETNNNKDLTMVVVAAAALVCVGLLAAFKAYVDRCTDFLGYIKTIAYYLTTAIAVSGVSYVVGNLVMRLIEELGLFETTSAVAMSLFLPETNPSLAYY